MVTYVRIVSSLIFFFSILSMYFRSHFSAVAILLVVLLSSWPVHCRRGGGSRGSSSTSRGNPKISKPKTSIRHDFPVRTNTNWGISNSKPKVSTNYGFPTRTKTNKMKGISKSRHSTLKKLGWYVFIVFIGARLYKFCKRRLFAPNQ